MSVTSSNLRQKGILSLSSADLYIFCVNAAFMVSFDAAAAVLSEHSSQFRKFLIASSAAELES